MLLSNLQILKLTPFFFKLIYSAKFHPFLPLPCGFIAISDENSEWPGIQSKQMSSGKADGGISQLLIPPCPLDLPFFLLCLRGHVLRRPGKTEEKGIIVLPVRKLESGKECLGEIKKKSIWVSKFPPQPNSKEPVRAHFLINREMGIKAYSPRLIHSLRPQGKYLKERVSLTILSTFPEFRECTQDAAFRGSETVSQRGLYLCLGACSRTYGHLES